MTDGSSGRGTPRTAEGDSSVRDFASSVAGFHMKQLAEEALQGGNG